MFSDDVPWYAPVDQDGTVNLHQRQWSAGYVARHTLIRAARLLLHDGRGHVSRFCARGAVESWINRWKRWSENFPGALPSFNLFRRLIKAPRTWSSSVSVSTFQARCAEQLGRELRELVATTVKKPRLFFWVWRKRSVRRHNGCRWFWSSASFAACRRHLSVHPGKPVFVTARHRYSCARLQ